MPVDVQDILTRYKTMQAQQEQYLTDWQEIGEYCGVDATNITQRNTPGNLRYDRRFDSTGMEASVLFAASLQGSLTNQATEWERLKFRSDALNKSPGVADWLNETNALMLNAYAASNFYLSSHTYYAHYGRFGMAAMYEEERRDYSEEGTFFPGLNFRTLSPGRYVIAENAQGRVDTVFREVLLSPRQALQVFGADAVTQATREAAHNPSSTDKPLEYLHAVYPRGEMSGAKLGNQYMPYASVYVDTKSKHICRESGYEEFPFFVSRFRKDNEESPYGVGPGHVALPDMRSLDRLKEMALESVALHLQPPLNVIEAGVVGHISQISLASLAINRVTRTDAITPLVPTGNMNIVELEQADLRQAVRRAFHADQLELLLRPPSTQMTATEFVQRLRVLERLLGPSFFRLSWEFLDPLADRSFGILARAGVLPPPPVAVLLAAVQNNGQLDVEYVGPLARSQRAGDVEAISRVYSVGGQIVQSTGDASLWDNLDHDKALARVAEVEGLPAYLIRPPYDRDQLRAQRQQAQQAEAQQAQQVEALSALGSAAPFARAVDAPQGAEA